jgi:hypothetical protein
MPHQSEWRLFNVDSIVEGCPEPERTALTIDLCVASLAYKNFDFVAKRLPFVVECSTRDTIIWQRLIDGATERYWIRCAGQSAARHSDRWPGGRHRAS